nr:ATP-binding protein [Pedobacter sp. SYSU D00873]
MERQLKVEQDLLESQQRFKTVFEASIVANKIINIDLKMVQINQALCDMLGYSREEILGSTILDFTRPDFIDLWYDLHEALWKKELPAFQLEACLIKKDQTEVWVLVNTVSFKDRGQTMGYTSLVDITNRKLLERHKDEFISTVSHELKTPITSIKSYCQLVERDLLKDKKAEGLDKIRRMNAKINDLTSLIADLVMASKIESGKLRTKSERYAMDDLINSIVDDYKKTHPGRIFIIDKNESVITMGDRLKIGQVIENLITNATKFSDRGSPISISSVRKDGSIVVCIQDHGRGISPEEIESIFNRFYKVKEAQSNNEAGMGLGLYISSEIIRNQQGKLWVDSKVGEGSTFCFSLPIIS